MDVDSIEPGADFIEILGRVLSECDVLVAVIGRTWLNVTDGEGKRRLDDPDDLVRSEIAAALKRNIRVIPVLVDGAAMPKANDLPTDLSSITRRHAIVVSHERFGSDIGALVASIRRSRNTQRQVSLNFSLGIIFISIVSMAIIYWSVPWLQIIRHFNLKDQEIGATPQPNLASVAETRSLQEGASQTSVASVLGAVSRGLARIPLTHETIILYAAAPGGISLDGQTNSPFAAAISDSLRTGITDVDMIAKKVIADVRAISDNRQLPVYESNITRSINLANRGFQKIALVVGNAKYSHAAELTNPARDAEILARQLGHLDFEVVLALDAGREQMSRTINRFLDRMKASPKNTIALLYYGGHAIQLNGINYMLPTDVKLARLNDLEWQAISMQKFIEAIQSADITASIIMLDACRDNPFRGLFGTR